MPFTIGNTHIEDTVIPVRLSDCFSGFVWKQLPRVGIITWSNDVITVLAYYDLVRLFLLKLLTRCHVFQSHSYQTFGCPFIMFAVHASIGLPRSRFTPLKSMPWERDAQKWGTLKFFTPDWMRQEMQHQTQKQKTKIKQNKPKTNKQKQNKTKNKNKNKKRMKVLWVLDFHCDIYSQISVWISKSIMIIYEFIIITITSLKITIIIIHNRS